MATLSQPAAVRRIRSFAGPRGLVDQYFCLAMALLILGIVVSGFRRTINESLFRAAIPRPTILWFHGAAFFSWVIFFLFQSVLVRTRNVKWHRFFGWFGAALAAVMVPLGIATAIVMGRFDTKQLHQSGAEPFFIIPVFDMAVFGTLVVLAVSFRKKPELHRRLIFVGTCVLLDAAFARFDYLFDHNLFPFCPDAVISLGLVRDFLVNRRVHRVYLIALPALILLQSLVTLIWRSEAAWWVRIAHAILA